MVGGKSGKTMSTLFNLDETNSGILTSFTAERTFKESLGEDYLDVVETIAKLYVPDFTQKDLDTLIYFSTLSEREKYLNEDIDNNPGLTYVWTSLLASSQISYNSKAKVAPSPESDEFTDFVRTLTIKHFDKVRLLPPEREESVSGNQFEKVNQTYLMQNLHKFFASGGKENREESTSLLVGYLLYAYYMELRKISKRKSLLDIEPVEK